MDLLRATAGDQTLQQRFERARREGRLWVRTNQPHRNLVISAALSPSAEYLATGTDQGLEPDGVGSIAIWEIATGRCVNRLHAVQFGLGFEPARGCLKWAPDGQRLSVGFGSSGIGWVDPFEPAGGWFDEFCFWHSFLPQWCCAPDGERVFITLRGRGCITNLEPDDDYTIEPLTREDGSEIEPFYAMTWGAHGLIVGYRHDFACAIDAETLRVVWTLDLAEVMAGAHWRVRRNSVDISPDGRTLVYGSDHLTFIDTKTGERTATDVAGSRAVSSLGSLAYWAPDSRHLAIVGDGELRILHDQELVQRIPVSVDTDVYGDEMQDADQVAWAPDSGALAVRVGEAYRVYDIGDEPTEIFSCAAPPDSGVAFGANARLVVLTQETLRFVSVDGPTDDVVDLLAFAETDPEMDTPEIQAFSDGDKWGYAADDFIVASSDPSGAVHLSVDGRRAAPLSWADVPVYRTLAEARRANESEGPPANDEAEAYDEAETSGDQSGQPARVEEPPVDLPQMVELLSDAIVDRIVTRQRVSNTDAEALGQLALHAIADGRLDAAVAITERMCALLDADKYGALSAPLAHVAAYLCRAGKHAHAGRLLDRARGGLIELERRQEFRWFVPAAAWFGAARQLLGEDAAWLRAARATIPDGVDQAPRFAVASALALLGELNDAVDVVAESDDTSPFGIRWDTQRELFDLLEEHDDALERYVGLAHRRQWANHRLRDAVVGFCLDRNRPDDAWQALQQFHGITTDAAEDRIILHAYRNRGIRAGRALLEPLLAQAHSTGALATEARFIELASHFDLEFAAENLVGYFPRLKAAELAAHPRAEALAAAVGVLARLGMVEKLPRLFEDAPHEGRHWLEAARHYTVDDAFRAQVVDRSVSIAVEHARVHFDAAAVLTAVAGQGEFDQIFEALLDRLGRAPDKLEPLLVGAVRAAAFDAAERVPMRVRPSARTRLLATLFAEYLRAAEYERAARVFEAMDAQERADQAVNVAHRLQELHRRP